MKSKRVLSLVLALCLCLTMLPVVTMQAEAATITVFSQTDSRWGSHQYGYSNSAGTTPATISSGGCGILALVNAVYYMNGNFINPITLADWSVNNGYRVNGVGTSHGLYPAYSSACGSTYGFSCTSSAGTSSWDTLTSHLQNGGVAIVPTVTYATGSAHLLVIADYDSSNGTYLVLDSYASSYRGTSSGYAWMTKATFQNRMSCSKFILISNTSGTSGSHTHTYSGSYYEAAHPHRVYQMCSCGATQYTGATTTVSTCDTCSPVSTSSTYNTVLPFKAYLKGTSTVYPYSTAQLATTTGGEIWSTDECTITMVYSNGACKVTYPVGSSTKTAYTSLSNFIGNTSASLTKQTVNHQVTTYIRASTSSTVYGYISAGDTIYKMGTSGSMTQVFYPVSSGYKLAWVLTSELTEPTYDTRFNPYCPIKGYPCATATFNAYDSDYTTDIGDIWTTDYCTINAVYADGWCQVTYPISSGTKTGYTKLSNFVYNTSATHTKYTATAQMVVSTTNALTTELGKIFAGDVFYVVGTYGSTSQVLYPIDAEYGGGYKMGWISTSALPKTTYTVSYNANGGSGAPSSQTKTHGTALTLSTTVPTRAGYAFVGWATSSSATSATYAPGSSYTTDANLTLYAVWTLNKYEITYNANGGTNAPATQNKAHGTDLTLSTEVPTKAYTITFDPNGGTVDVANRQGSCEFLGWAMSGTATSAAYQPGGTFTTNANTTLYAVWKNPTLGQYSIPVREGHVFDGWYTAASDGTQVTLSTVVSSNMTVYAHWVVATYGVNYDANGGTGAPDTQTKTHGKDLTLSTTIPTRENYTFLGWATEENPNEGQYQPGDTYSADSDIMLIAVWKYDLNPTITVGNTSGKPGDSVTVAVQITENPGIIAARLKISYDSSVLTLTEVTDGGILGEYKFNEDMSSNPYIVSWSNGTTETDYTATGDLVYLTFKIAENASSGDSLIVLSYDEEEIYNKNLENIDFGVTQGNIQIQPPIEYQVIYQANGGTGAPNAQIKYENVALSLSSTQPTRPGYTFTGWCAGSTSGEVCYQPGDIYTDNADITLYAIWEKGCENDQHAYRSAVTAPTCTERGYNTYICELCGDSYISDYVAALGHKYNVVVITPTCTEQGYTNYSCSTCGDSYVGDRTNALGHTPVTDAAVAPSCTAAGLTEGSHCSVCGEIIIAQENAPALGHHYNTVVTAPTCSTAGFTTYTCSACDDTYIDNYTKANGHNYDFAVTAPTCTTIGYTTYTCTVCGNNYVSNYTNVLGHSFEVNVSAPTCTNDGYTTYTCTVCSYSYISDYTKAFGHICGSVVTKPTCTVEGYTTYTCFTCAYSYIADQIESIGHSYEAVATAPTCANSGYTTFACSACGESYTGDHTAALGHNYVEGECSVCGDLTLFIKNQPVTKFVKDGNSAAFSVKAIGDDLTYQWQYRTSSSGSWKNASATGNKTKTLSVAATVAKHGYQYRCKITDTAGNTVYTSVVTLNVLGIKTQPVNKTVKAGATAKLTVSAVGDGLTYQWQYRTSSSGSWKNASATGNKTKTLSVAATVAKHGYQYRCKITDSAGNVIYTNVVDLYVLGIKTQPANKTVKAGATAKLTVSAVGDGLTYQWQYRTSSSGSWKNASATGNKTKTLSVAATVAKHGYQYRCKITDTAGNTVYSSVVTLNVLGIKTQPANKTVKTGATAKFTVAAVGDGLTYQWQYRTSSSGSWKNVSVASGKTANYSLTAAARHNGYQYRCKITDSAGNVIYTSIVKLTVK